MAVYYIFILWIAFYSHIFIFNNLVNKYFKLPLHSL
jgi:hypothetical protein